MITLNDRPLTKLAELPKDTRFLRGQVALFVVEHCDDDTTHAKLCGRHPTSLWMPSDLLVQVIKAPPTWYP
jgi:hypothetical protein